MIGIRGRRAVLAAAIAVVPGIAAAAPGAAPRTPIRHLVVLMQENRSFDHYFGTYPGADGIPPAACLPTGPRRRPCVVPFRLGSPTVPDPGHDTRLLRAQYALRAHAGFIRALRGGGLDARVVAGHYDGRDIPYYWNLARRYVLFDHFFSASASGGVANRMYWLTATPGGPGGSAIPPAGYGDLPTIFDRLGARGISWRVYVQGYDPRITFRTRGEFGDRGLQVARLPLLAFRRYVDDPRLSGHIVDLNRYYADLARGRLPAVAYVVSTTSSEHPPNGPQAGERLVRGLLTALSRSGAWSSSAFLLTYDDWGGWYDHVQPPRRDREGDAFRVPALMVSPFARRGRVDHEPLDITSVLRFIEWNWGLPALSGRDAAARNLLGAFDFRDPPRPPELVPATLAAPALPRPRTTLIYGAYGAAAMVALLTLAAASAGGGRRPGRREAG